MIGICNFNNTRQYSLMYYQLFLACFDDTPSKGVGDFTVPCVSTTSRCDVVNPVGEKRVSEDIISTVK